MEAIRLIFFVRDGDFSNSTVEYLLERGLKPTLVIIERRNKRLEIKTYIRTQGYFRLLLFIIKIYTRKVFYRKKKSLTSEQICDKYSVEYVIVENHNGAKSIKYLEKIKPELGIICAARIISENVIKKFNRGIINCHSGWLPDYRGWDALRWSILEGGNIGITCHFINPKVDAGPIITQEKINSKKFRNFPGLYKHALEIRNKLLWESVEKIINNDFSPVFQPTNVGKRYYRMNLFKMLFVNLKLFRNFRR